MREGVGVARRRACTCVVHMEIHMDLRSTGPAAAADLAMGEGSYYNLRVPGERMNRHEGDERLVLVHKKHMASEA